MNASEGTKTSYSSTVRRRREMQTSRHQTDHLKKRDIEFVQQTVSVVKKIGQVETSYLYSAKSYGRNQRSANNSLNWIKATVAATNEEARRAETEVRLLRKLSRSHGLPNLLDSGFSTITEREPHFGVIGVSEERLDQRRLYCLLFESCPDSLVTDFVKKRRKKYDNRRTRSLFSRKKKDETWEGYLPIGIVLDIFRQMADAVSVLHSIQEDSDSGNRSQFSGSVSERFRKGLTHLDIQPSRFVIRRIKEKGEDGERHEVTLATFGALVHGSMSLNKDVERDVATRIINSSSNPLYRSPEMINLHMWDEITGSADIWALGCCFYYLLFLTECFKNQSKLDVLRGVFLIPAKHPYEQAVIEFLARMLIVNPARRASIQEVIECIEALKQSKELPPRRVSTASTEVDTDCETDRVANMGALDVMLDSSGRRTTMTSSSLSSTGIKAKQEVPVDTGNLDALIDDSWGVSAGERSDSSEFSEWLEFQPDASNGSNLQHRSAPGSVIEQRAKKKHTSKRRRRRNDPLNLGKARRFGDERRQSLFSDWTLGVINQLSTRSLNPIENDTSEEGSAGNKSGITPLREPSMRTITSLAAQKKLNQLVGPRSLRVSDLSKTSTLSAVSTSASSTNDWRSDGVVVSKTTVQTPPPTQSFLVTPSTAPARMGVNSAPSLLNSRLSPNVAPAEPYLSMKEGMISPTPLTYRDIEQIGHRELDSTSKRTNDGHDHLSKKKKKSKTKDDSKKEKSKSLKNHKKKSKLSGEIRPSSLSAPTDWVRDAGQWIKTEFPNDTIPDPGKEIATTEALSAPSVDNLVLSPQLTDSTGFPIMTYEHANSSHSAFDTSESTPIVGNSYNGRFLSPEQPKREKGANSLIVASSGTIPKVRAGQHFHPGTAILEQKNPLFIQGDAGHDSNEDEDYTMPLNDPLEQSLKAGVAINRQRSGLTDRSGSSTLHASLDTNVPPGDEMVDIEVSVPMDEESRFRSLMSVVEEVQLALTAQGRQRRRSIKQLEEESQHASKGRMASNALEESKPLTRHTETSTRPSKSPLAPTKPLFESKRTRQLEIPVTIELMEKGKFPHVLPMDSPQKQVLARAPMTAPLSAPTPATESLTPYSPQTAVENHHEMPALPNLTDTPGSEEKKQSNSMKDRSSKKKKKKKKEATDKDHKHHKKEKRKRSKSERIRRPSSIEAELTTEQLVQSMTELMEQKLSYQQDLEEADRVAKEIFGSFRSMRTGDGQSHRF